MEEQPPETEPEFSPEQLEEFQETFSVFDKDGDGKLTLSEFDGCLQAVGISTSSEMVEEFCQKNDPLSTNLFDIEIFYKAISYFNSQQNLEEILTKCFKVFYGDDSRFQIDSFNKYMTCLGNPLTPDELKQLWYNVAPDGDSDVNIADIVKILCGGSADEADGAD